MKVFQTTVLLLSIFLVGDPAFAEKMLVPPSSQAPECKYSYDYAAQPKTANNVKSAMTQICTQRGGMHVLHKVLVAGESNEPTGVVLTCVGDNPNLVIFNCLFATSYGDL